MANFYLGLDVSKGYADLIMINQRKQIVEQSFQLDDTVNGHKQLCAFLSTFFKSHPTAVVYAAVESTGGYENNWFKTLHQIQHPFDIKVARLNPCGVTHNSKAGLQRIVTDKLSAKYIAEYMIDHPEKICYETHDYFYQIRRKWKFIKTLVKEKVRFLNQLEILVYDANPELLPYCRHSVPQWILRLLKRYPTAETLKQASVQDVAQIPYISENKAQRLISNAQTSVASADDVLTADTIILLCTEILRLEGLIAQQTRLIAQYQQFPEVDLLKTFTGIKDLNAIGLLINIGSHERYLTCKHLSSFSGVHPVFKSSGDGISGIHMSKKGSREIRAILFMIALTAIRTNPLIRDLYWYHVNKGREKLDAIGICMHKILRIVYGMLKNNTPFDPEIDRANRIKSISRGNGAAKNTLRRYQDLDELAPISGRQSNKRKEKEKSQDDHIVMNGIKFPPLSLN